MKDDYTTNSRHLTYTPKSDQFQITALAASPGILHHTVWRTWLIVAYSDANMIIMIYLAYTFLLKKLGKCTFWTWGVKGLKSWENVPFQLGSERVTLDFPTHPWATCLFSFPEVTLLLSTSLTPPPPTPPPPPLSNYYFAYAGSWVLLKWVTSKGMK